MTRFSSLGDHQKGLLITAIGGLVLTVDIPLIKLASGDPWSILLIRSGCTMAVMLIAWSFLNLRSQNYTELVPGRVGLIVSALYGISSITFMISVFNTSTANLVFILAFNPMFSALLAWIFLKEKPKPITLAAMVLMVAGVAIIVGDGLQSGNLFGDLLALLSAFLLSAAITITRGSGRDMGFAALAGTVLPFAVSLFIIAQSGFRIEVPGWILLNGLIIMPLSFFCLALGPKFISGPEVAMFYLLETILAPIWVWMIFSEVPTRNTLIGGVILIATLIAHSTFQLISNRRRNAAQAPRHPV